MAKSAVEKIRAQISVYGAQARANRQSTNGESQSKLNVSRGREEGARQRLAYSLLFKKNAAAEAQKAITCAVKLCRGQSGLDTHPHHHCWAAVLGRPAARYRDPRRWFRLSSTDKKRTRFAYFSPGASPTDCGAFGATTLSSAVEADSST